MNAIETDGLEKRFGALRALRDLSICVPAGSMVLVSGPNGAGKTTLLKILGGLMRPTSGSVRVLGEDPFGPRRVGLRGRSAYLGQESGLYAELTLEENLQFAARLHGVNSERLHAVVSELDLEALLGRRSQTYSQGFSRRAGLARTLLPGPELLLLDEPWNGLDAASSERLAKRLGRARDDGATLLVAAHAAGEQRPIFDFELELEGGALASLEPIAEAGA